MADDKLDIGPDSSLEPADPSTDQDSEDESQIPPEILESMPPESRRQLIRSMSSMVQFRGPVFNPVLRRITSGHITQLIANAEAQNNRDAASEKSNRLYQFLYFVLALAALLFLLIFFTLREQYSLLAAVVTGAMGFGSGFGIGKFTGRR